MILIGAPSNIPWTRANSHQTSRSRIGRVLINKRNQLKFKIKFQLIKLRTPLVDLFIELIGTLDSASLANSDKCQFSIKT